MIHKSGQSRLLIELDYGQLGALVVKPLRKYDGAGFKIDRCIARRKWTLFRRQPWLADESSSLHHDHSCVILRRSWAVVDIEAVRTCAANRRA